MNIRKIISLLYHQAVTGRRHWRHLQNLKEWQWLPPGQLQPICEQRLRDLLAHAGKHVPYYAEVLRQAEVIDSNGQVNLENFSRIPLLDKAIMRENLDAIKSDDFSRRRGIAFSTSSGTTGESIQIVQDRGYAEWNYPVKLLGDEWSGYSFGQKRVLLWGAETVTEGRKEPLQTRMQRWLNNQLWLDTFRMTPEDMARYVQIINRVQPVQILAFPESIYDLANYLKRNHLTIFSPLSIQTSSGTLFPHMRAVIEEVFRAPVFNRYGAQETGAMAYECEHHSGLHVFPPEHHLEILLPDGSPAGPGQAGEVVVTLLSNYIMPIIRYKIGDIAAWAGTPCPCGRSWPLLKEIEGRVSGIFISPSGARVHGIYLGYLMFYRDWAGRFQIIQEDYELVRMIVARIYENGKPREPAHDEMAEIEEKIRLVLGEGCRVEWEFVDEITPTPAGKHCYIISKVAEIT
ncbi:MAG: phenylacetate--CoA ligase family protein [Planctomycetes bacterium]|nr:phenylacetate--CoA ligase family protein [Planctomycetota bacterium]